MKKATLEKQVEHHWKPMEEYKFEESIVADSLDEEDKIALQRMQHNQFYIIRGCVLGLDETDDLRDTGGFVQYIKSLIINGFDIGNDADSQYGYKMPLPKNGDTERRLIIFRRH